jgi:hypothetical protein
MFSRRVAIMVNSMRDTQIPTVETLTREIGDIVAERQALRAAGASTAELEANRKRLTEAQAHLSRLLIASHLPHPEAA